MDWLIPVGLVALLVATNAVYVAAEFSSVASRKTRLEAMAEEGDRLAGWVKAALSTPARLDRYVAAAQLGITIASLVLGFYGQTRLAVLLAPVLASCGLPRAVAPGAAVTIILLLLTAFQVVLGELFPKSVGLQYPEAMARAAAVPMRPSLLVFRPLIALFYGSARMLLRLLRVPDGAKGHIHSADEIRLMAGESKSGGLLDAVEYYLLDNALRIRQYTAHQTMVPRTRLLTASVDTPPRELLELLASSPHSRLPLYEQDMDNIVGVVHLKDLLSYVVRGRTGSVREIMRAAPCVPESLTVKRLFSQLQREHFHMAVVLDEYGGTAGIVTLEDLIERIFGEFEDEFDQPEPPMWLDGKRLRVAGDVLVDDLNEWLDLSLPSAQSDTVGGLVLDALGRVPHRGEEVVVEGVPLRVEQASRTAVQWLSLKPDQALLELLRERGLL